LVAVTEVPGQHPVPFSRVKAHGKILLDSLALEEVVMALAEL